MQIIYVEKTEFLYRPDILFSRFLYARKKRPKNYL